MDTIEPNSNSGKDDMSPKRELDVGLTLRQGRERLGMSVFDIAERIKFAPKQVEALEANDFAHLPEAAYLRGFVRSYARVLQLDEAALIAALPVELSRQVISRTRSVNVAFPTSMALQRINLTWLAGALVIVLVLASFLVAHKGEQAAKTTVAVVEPVQLPATDVAVSGVENTEVQAAIAEPAKLAEPAENPVPSPASVAEPVKKPEPVRVVEPVKAAAQVKADETIKKAEPVKVVRPKERTLPVSASAVVPAAPDAEAASAPEANAKPETPLEVLMLRPLHFVFDEAMFAEVIDARGNVLMSRNVPRGAEKWIGGPGRAPYEISISKPGKAKLYYRGKEIDLSGYPATEMAHLKVQ
jgi:cytoskeleton protein RodZ